MAITLTGDTLVLDESSGLQNSGIPTSTEDNNDDDVGFGTLHSVFAARLFDPVISGGLALDDDFAQDKGVAVETVINISGGTTVTGFLDGSDNPLLAFQSGVTDPTTGVETSFTTLDGEKIYLFVDQDSGLGDMMVMGVDANGSIVFAAFLNPGATSADIWMVQFEAISNPDASDPDDPVDLSDLLNVGAATPLSFNFNALPSGQNLFGTVGTSATDPAIIVIGKDIVLKADGTFTNASNTINTSQGGGPTTIGVNNQMFNPGEGAYFSYVDDPVANFLSGAPGGLNQNEADDADNIQYTGGTHDVTGAFFVISQIQGNSLATTDITTYLAAGDTGRNFVSSLGDGPSPDIIRVKVYNAAGTLIEDTGDLGNFNSPTVNVTGLDTPTVRVSGLGANYKVEWITDGDHNQALIQGVAGKFDIGAFGISEGDVSSVPVGDKLIFEDDGPTVVRSADPVPTLTVDDSDFGTDDSASFASLFTANFGTDGEKDADNDGNPDANATTYALGVSGPDADSGLLDTLTNEKVVLNLVGADVVGTTETGGLEVFRITVDASGNVTLDQSRAVVHDDPTDPDEATSPATLAAASLVTLTATVTDDDGDTDAETADIGDAFEFKDDGPAIDRSEEAVPTLTVDDSDFGTNDSASFAGLFTAPDFGADGPKDSDDDDVPDTDATTYALGVSGPDADSGLIDTLTNEKVVLNLVGTDVVGTTETGGLEVFRITVDASGNVTLDQSRAVVHDDPLDPDEAASPAVLAAASLVTLTATITDGDGDTDAATADIGDAFEFKDDGPSVVRSADPVPTLTVDDSDFGTDDSASFAGLFTPDFGADGPKDSDDDDVPDADATTYALGVSGPDADSGLIDTLTNEKVILNLVGTDVVGTTEIGGLEVFRIAVDASGNVTLDQSRAVVHDDPLDPDEAASPAVLAAASLVTLTATITDGDGDTDAATADIGDAFEFKDDGPDIVRSADPVPTLTVDDSDFGTDDSASFASLFTPDFGADGPKDSDDDDVPDADATTYALGVSGPDADSGLIDTLTNEKVVLNLVGTDVVGTTETGGLEVFRITVDASGNVTLDQSRAVVHDDPLDPDESSSPAVLAAASLVTLTATVTDGDGDTDAATADIGDAFEFKDDGPSVVRSADPVPLLTVDDSDFGTDDSASFASLFTPDFGADGAKDSDDDDVPDADATTYALGVSGPDADSGLVDTLTNEKIVLNLVGTDVVGTTEIGGLEVFRITVDASGNVTLDQSRAVVHDDPLDPDEATSPAVLAAASLVTLTATITDGDGDTDAATADIGDAFQFKDDGPAIDRSEEAVPLLTVDDSDFGTDDSASFAGLFTTPDFGADGPKDSDDDDVPDADAVAYAVGVSGPDADSGLVDTLTNEKVVLNLVGTDVVGTTEIGGLEVFRITVDASGNVTLDQSRAVVHDDPLDPDEAASPAVLISAGLVTLTATITDGDGDTDAATADIGDAFQFKDDGPSIVRSADPVPLLTVDDSDFGTDDSASFAGLFTPDFGADGSKDSDDDDVADADATTYALGVSGPDADSGLIDTLTNEKVLLNLVGTDVVGTTEIGGLEVFRISVDASGNVTLDQSRAVVHDDPLDPDESSTPAVLAAASLVTLTATITDGDGDTDAATADIGDAFQFKDDGPDIDPSADPVPTLTVDDSDLVTNATLSFAGLFTAPAFGADGPKDTDDNDVADTDAITYALGVNVPGSASGIFDTLTGEAVVLDKVGDDIVGTTETTGLEVFRISVDVAGNVTLDQSRAVVHDDPADPDEATSPAVFNAADLVTLTATITDGDGDTAAATVDISAAFQFKDDGPAVGPISDDLVDFVTGSSASNLLGAVEGADGASAKITDFTPSLTYDFATLLGELSGDEKSVIYFQDVGGTVGTFDDGIDVKFFTLAIDDSDADAANWDYTFTVHQDAPPASIEFDFDALPSGQNLFGTVGSSSTDPAIIVIGRDIVLKADNTFDNSSNTINTSQGGGPTTIGVNNQMFDAGEGAYFSYVDDPVANFLSGAPGGLDQNEADDADNIQYTGGTVDVTSAFFVISQLQGNDLATVDITTYLLGTAETGVDFVTNLGNGTSPDIIRVKVYDENGDLIEDTGDLGNFNDATVVVTGIGDPTVRVAGLDADYRVEWITDGEHNQSLVEGVAGKFDIGLFGISEPTPTPDKELEFTVAITDFDGDVEDDTFTIGIDGNHDGSINIV